MQLSISIMCRLRHQGEYERILSRKAVLFVIICSTGFIMVITAIVVPVLIWHINNVPISYTTNTIGMTTANTTASILK
ncbi:unnamed protein product [Adineta steineri]|uniref:Uncharacterized protein n=1 Tax=Adineta steineri TaxID=433720 RepID=A0A819FV21_9BILA|nr:unnamed protein product [Adineta steineri]